MHDWTFISIEVEWKSGAIVMNFLDSRSIQRVITAQGMVGLNVPRTNDWGPSVSVLQVNPLEPAGNGVFRLSVEMQSGDKIELLAKNIDLPSL